MGTMGQVFAGAVFLGAAGAPALAVVEKYACSLDRDAARLDLRFDIDPASFAPALDPKDPPRRQVSRVALREERFDAEAILMEDGTRGFWDAARGLMMTMAPGGAARLTEAAQPAWLGHCRVVQ